MSCRSDPEYAAYVAELERELLSLRNALDVDGEVGVRRRPAQYIETTGRRFERSAQCGCCKHVYAWSLVGDDTLCYECSESWRRP